MIATSRRIPMDPTIVRIQAFHAGVDEESISDLCGSYKDLQGDMALFPQFLNDLTALYYFLTYHEVPWHYLDVNEQTRLGWNAYGSSKKFRTQKWKRCCSILRKEGLRCVLPSGRWTAIVLSVVCLVAAAIWMFLLH